jgi:general secretion pathway protein G
MRKATKGLKKAFTLVEILIVVVILGILAAIVIPQFTNATQDAQAGNLRAQLASLQNQVELFRARNNNTAPITTAAANWTALVSGNYIKAAPSNPASSLTDKTSISVAASGTGSASTSWLYRSDTNTLFASFFNETTGAVTTTGTD